MNKPTSFGRAKGALLIPAFVSAQGSVAQLREVWEETDGLDPQEFNPKTFFKLHGEARPPF